MAIWQLETDDGGETEIEANDLRAARAAADAWVRAGDYEIERTIWIRVRIGRPEDDFWEDTRAVAVDPPEPRCEDGDEHGWCAPYWLLGGLQENPGVRGHGGGVVIAEACLRCGARRVTDTWATDISTGEQGLKSVSYDADYYDTCDVPAMGSVITDEMIDRADAAGACSAAIDWLRAEPRTVADLYEHRAWYRWAMEHMCQPVAARMAA